MKAGLVTLSWNLTQLEDNGATKYYQVFFIISLHNVSATVET